MASSRCSTCRLKGAAPCFFCRQHEPGNAFSFASTSVLGCLARQLVPAALAALLCPCNPLWSGGRQTSESHRPPHHTLFPGTALTAIEFVEHGFQGNLPGHKAETCRWVSKRTSEFTPNESKRGAVSPSPPKRGSKWSSHKSGFGDSLARWQPS